MGDVFFSYKREDKHRVQLFFLELQKAGFKVAWDQKILTGEAWENWIFDQLIAAKAVVVFWSHDSINSEYVRKEARLAHDGKKLIPVFIDRLSPIEKGRLLGFDGLQHAELIDWKGNTEDIAWQEFIKAIERVITPAYVERLISRKSDELYHMRLLRDTVIERETTFEKRIQEAESARLEAINTERATGLLLAEATQKLEGAVNKARELEVNLREVHDNLERERTVANELTERLQESSLVARQVSTALEKEKKKSHRLQATRRFQTLSAVAISLVSIAIAAISVFALQPTPANPIREGHSHQALVDCEKLAGDAGLSSMPGSALQARFGDCKLALTKWFREVGSSTRPVIASFGRVVRPEEAKADSVSGWRAGISETLHNELANLGLALAAELPSLNALREENKELARKNDILAAQNRELHGKFKLGRPKPPEAADEGPKATSSAEAVERCDRLAGDPFDETQTSAKRPTRAVRELEADPEPAIRGCEEALKQANDPRLNYQLGRALNAAKNKLALEKLELARQAGYPASITLLGWIYREGALGEKDLRKAKAYYEEAIALKDPAAMVQMAYMYRKEEFRMADNDKAFALYSMAAEKKFPSALMTVGEYYREGSVVDKDCNLAIKYFGEAARLGNLKAVDHLAGIATRKGCR